MERGVVLSLAAALGAGSLMIVQSLINSALGRGIGSLQAATLSASVSVAVLAAASFAVGGGFGRLGSDPVPWHYVGGVLGAVILTASLVTVRTLGAAGVSVALIAGQLTAAIVIDQYGLLGATPDPASLTKIVGVGMLAGGVYLIVGR